MEEVTDIAILMCAVRSGRPVIAQAAAAPAAACLPGGVPACPPRARSTPAARHRAPAARQRAPAARPIILATAIPWRARRGRPDAFLSPSCMPCHSAPARPTSHAIICPAQAAAAPAATNKRATGEGGKGGAVGKFRRVLPAAMAGQSAGHREVGAGGEAGGMRQGCTCRQG